MRPASPSVRVQAGNQCKQILPLDALSVDVANLASAQAYGDSENSVWYWSL